MQKIKKKYTERILILRENRKNKMPGDIYPYDFEIGCIKEFLQDLSELERKDVGKEAIKILKENIKSRQSIIEFQKRNPINQAVTESTAEEYKKIIPELELAIKILEEYQTK